MVGLSQRVGGGVKQSQVISIIPSTRVGISLKLVLCSHTTVEFSLGVGRDIIGAPLVRCLSFGCNETHYTLIEPDGSGGGPGNVVIETPLCD